MPELTWHHFLNLVRFATVLTVGEGETFKEVKVTIDGEDYIIKSERDGYDGDLNTPTVRKLP